MIVVLMGVSGSGKTTIGKLLAKKTGATFADADDYHPAANKQKMASGHALSDEDRQPWLEVLNRLMLGWFQTETSGILACSALKQKYRTTLIAGMAQDSVKFVLLDGSPALIAGRLAARHHEFMNADLLASQLQTLERAQDTYAVVNDRSPEAVVAEIMQQLGLSKSS